MISSLQQVINSPHRVYIHKEIDYLPNYLTQPEVPRGPIPQMS
jgi:hypothetical protein